MVTMRERRPDPVRAASSVSPSMRLALATLLDLGIVEIPWHHRQEWAALVRDLRRFAQEHAEFEG